MEEPWPAIQSFPIRFSVFHSAVFLPTFFNNKNGTRVPVLPFFSVRLVDNFLFEVWGALNNNGGFDVGRTEREIEQLKTIINRPQITIERGVESERGGAAGLMNDVVPRARPLTICWSGTV